MNLAYVFLLITVVIALFCKDRRVLYVAILFTNILGFYDGIVHIYGLASLGALALLSYCYFNTNSNKFVKIILFTLITVFIVGLGFHQIPGFSNELVINRLKLSELSVPFSMYLNFDKVMAALIIFSVSNIGNKVPDGESLKITIYLLISCVMLAMIPAFLTGYVKLDLKIPDVILLWSINNFFFVCASEEIFFRGLLQSTLRNLLKPISNFSYTHIIISAIIFGLAHFAGGFTYIILASICGFFYGYTYYKTNSLLCSMLVHFGLNFSHFILFTYPVAL